MLPQVFEFYASPNQSMRYIAAREENGGYDVSWTNPDGETRHVGYAESEIISAIGQRTFVITSDFTVDDIDIDMSEVL